MSDIVCVEQEFLRFFIEISSHQISVNITAKKMKFSIKDFSSKCDQIRRKLRIWSHLLKKYLMENFIFVHLWYWTNPQNLMHCTY